MTFQTRTELAQAHQFFIVDSTGGFVHRIEKRASMPLRKDEAIVIGVIGAVKIIFEIACHEHGHEIGCRHTGCGVTGAGSSGRSDTVDSELTGKLGDLFYGQCLYFHHVNSFWLNHP
ncbi:MAG: hypothetical protein BWY75_03395 [bacterium ADurb.Bin425]|nr:MAG: hypothetical protein BWY75_03395 [bacterium ADurb.Bin425]